MAQWKETLEPYVRVQERIKTATLNPTAGEDLIIGAVIISDAGPSTPTLITSQREFKDLYASGPLGEDYMSKLGKLYEDDPTVAPTMWSNAYRLAGSNSMLVVRATKADGINVIQPLDKNTKGDYIVRDGQVLKKVSGGFKISIEPQARDGWGIDLAEVGKIGCYVTDEGAVYDYYVNNMPDLVKKLNETPNFYSPSYAYQNCNITKSGSNYSIALTDEKANLPSGDPSINTVFFKEVYIGAEFLNISASETVYSKGLANLIITGPNTANSEEDPAEDPNQEVVLDFSKWEPARFDNDVEFYATNVYNSAATLKIRIRRFNHDAVIAKEIDSVSYLSEDTESPYVVLENVLKKSSALDKDRDFYEIALLDSTISDEVVYYNVGNLPGRGDIEASELNGLTSMISFNLPDNLEELGLDYYGLPKFVQTEDLLVNDERVIKKQGESPYFNNADEIDNPIIGKYYALVDSVSIYTDKGETIFKDLGIAEESSILKVTTEDLRDALDLLANDEIYVVEGLTDLGMTEPSFQNALATLAINENFFYPISTVNSTNYMVLANKFKSVPQESSKLYGLAPWDIDTSTLGWKYYTSPSVMYWETVARNRRNNQEFRSCFGQVGGIIQYQRPTTEFNKKTRQLLLSKKINTVLWNNTTQAWNINDNYTKQSEDNILSDEANSRLFIRISKAQPVLLKQFIGRRITERLCKDIVDTITYWFHSTILTMEYNIDDFNVFCEYDEALARKNKVKVVINVRFQRALKFIEVYNNAFDVGMSIEGME